RGTDRLNHHIEESHEDVVHHAPGLDPDSGTAHAMFPWITHAYTQNGWIRCTVGYSSVANPS
ncbi:MAG: hypothetical protein K2X52_25230, partial [Mycobacteriaceae bacterium]|nr:hypothetical protein [Mycobacteriaceae bacterium]